MNKFINKIINNKILMLLAMFIVIAAVTCFPFLSGEVYGYNKDVTYHLFRIEGLVDCIKSGEFPARIYRNFFGGYGYGSPMFYPDILLLPAALLRLIGVGISKTYKLYVLLLTIAASCTTYYSSKVIIKDFKLSVVSTYMIMLSQFYLANIMCRAGLSEYLGYVFLPLVFAGVYDFFENDAKRIYLLGLGFGGMILSHTLLAFLGGLIVFVLFIIGIIRDITRHSLQKRGRAFIKLCITAVVTILITGFYLFPMIEQLLSVDMGVNTPWTFIGDNTQPLYTLFSVTGYFFRIAYVGVGIPLLILTGVRIFFGHSRLFWANVFYFAGIALFLAATNIVPWYLFNNTIFNSIQFTFRLYPYAIFMLTTGCIMHIADNAAGKDTKNCATHLLPRVIIVFVCLAVAFGVWENIFLMTRENEPDFHTDVNAIDMSTTYEVGEGKEWLPTKAQDVYLNWSRDDGVIISESEVDTVRQGRELVFHADASGDYICPLTYYKGYKATLTDEGGGTYELDVQESDTGQVEVVGDSSKTGEINVYYGGTLIQTISLIISIVTVIGVIVYIIARRKGLFVGKSDIQAESK